MKFAITRKGQHGKLAVVRVMYRAKYEQDGPANTTQRWAAEEVVGTTQCLNNDQAPVHVKGQAV